MNNDMDIPVPITTFPAQELTQENKVNTLGDGIVHHGEDAAGKTSIPGTALYGQNLFDHGGSFKNETPY